MGSGFRGASQVTRQRKLVLFHAVRIADARQGLQIGSRAGNLARVPLEEGLTEREHVSGLVAEQADRLDVLADPLLAQGNHRSGHQGQCDAGNR